MEAVVPDRFQRKRGERKWIFYTSMSGNDVPVQLFWRGSIFQIQDHIKEMIMPHRQGTPTYAAAAAGTVITAGWSNSAGNWVVISHGNGLVTKYMHHSSICVSAGQRVAKDNRLDMLVLQDIQPEHIYISRWSLTEHQ